MERPDPDALLRRVQAEEERAGRGRLKIFLGYAAGVGKTYAMLEAAHQRKAEGVDVVVGYVETHGRAETEALLAGSGGAAAAAGARTAASRCPSSTSTRCSPGSPQLALVDELAHTNAPGVRHPKRYQDVEELLAAGIDVYTTLNVQHLESLNDVVAQITGTRATRDRARPRARRSRRDRDGRSPARRAAQRLREGKVYVPEQAAPGGGAVLPQGQPDRAARDGAAPGGGARRRPDARVHADAGHPGTVARERAHPGLRERKSQLGAADPLGAAAGR